MRVSTSIASMIAFENAQQLRLKGLGAQTDAIDAGRGQHVGFVGVEGAGIGLDGPLAARRQDEPALDDLGKSG